MVSGEKARAPLPTVTVCTPLEEDDVLEGAAATEEAEDGDEPEPYPNWPRVKGRADRKMVKVLKCIVGTFEADGVLGVM